MRRKSSSKTTAVPILPWETYLAGQGAGRQYRDCHSRYAPAFARQRALIRRIVEQIRPKAVACLGAGVLNDVPYRALLDSGAQLHLVDWLPGAIKTGIALSIVETDESGAPACAYCALGDARARECCTRFHRSGAAARQVCDRFVALSRQPPGCGALEIGSWPRIHVEDATGGYASAFARGLEAALGGVGTWKQALARANKLARRVKRRSAARGRLGIADASVDLVTSSMLLSQFEHEPYDYFSRLVGRLVGAPGADEERRLNGAMEQLREFLVDYQIEEHCAEIRRILAPGGRVFMSFELFHRNPHRDDWFLVKQTHRGLAVLDRYFHFDFDLLDARDSATRFQASGAPSLVLNLVLGAKVPAKHH